MRGYRKIMHKEKIKEMRDKKVHKEGQTKKYQGEKKERKKRKKKDAHVAVLTRNTDEVPQ